MSNKILFSKILIFVIIFPCSVLFAQDSTNAKSTNIEHGQHFIDEDGDGYNDNAPDHDNDGIPNGLDPDWQKEKGQKGKGNRRRYVDLDGDGINDNIQEEKNMETPEYQQEQNRQRGTSIENQEKMGKNKQKRKKGPNN
jgi:hypothetical protein